MLLMRRLREESDALRAILLPLQRRRYTAPLACRYCAFTAHIIRMLRRPALRHTLIYIISLLLLLPDYYADYFACCRYATLALHDDFMPYAAAATL